MIELRHPARSARMAGRHQRSAAESAGGKNRPPTLVGLEAHSNGKALAIAVVTDDAVRPNKHCRAGGGALS